MPAFNKRLRETTYKGLKIRPLGGAIGFIVCGLLSGTRFFTGDFVVGVFLLSVAVAAGWYAVHEWRHDDDYRIRTIRRRAKTVRNTKQAMQ